MSEIKFVHEEWYNDSDSENDDMDTSSNVPDGTSCSESNDTCKTLPLPRIEEDVPPAQKRKKSAREEAELAEVLINLEKQEELLYSNNFHVPTEEDFAVQSRLLPSWIRKAVAVKESETEPPKPGEMVDQNYVNPLTLGIVALCLTAITGV